MAGVDVVSAMPYWLYLIVIVAFIAGGVGIVVLVVGLTRKSR